MTARSILTRLRRRVAPFFRREDGSAMVEFVMVLPVIMLVFTLAFESGLYMVRYIMLDRAVDQTIRDLRLGRFAGTPPADMHELLKNRICGATVLLRDCGDTIRIELRPVSTTTWAMPTLPTTCFDRDEDVNLSLRPNPGVANELMLVRVCVIQDAMFPDAAFAQDIRSDEQGGYRLIAISGFVNEP